MMVSWVFIKNFLINTNEEAVHQVINMATVEISGFFVICFSTQKFAHVCMNCHDWKLITNYGYDSHTIMILIVHPIKSRSQSWGQCNNITQNNCFNKYIFYMKISQYDQQWESQTGKKWLYISVFKRFKVYKNYTGFTLGCNIPI